MISLDKCIILLMFIQFTMNCGGKKGLAGINLNTDQIKLIIIYVK